jgi:hypothetical protein
MVLGTEPPDRRSSQTHKEYLEEMVFHYQNTFADLKTELDLVKAKADPVVQADLDTIKSKIDVSVPAVKTPPPPESPTAPTTPPPEPPPEEPADPTQM